MGLDLRSIALPLDSAPVREIRTDAALWQVAADHPPFTTTLVPLVLPEVTRALLAVLPPDAGWAGHFPDRAFQQAEYLLDPVAFRASGSWEERERSTAYRIVHGDEVFAAHAVSGQGMPWRCSTTAFLAEAVDEIDTVDVAGARAAFSVAEMVRAGLYKVQPGEDDDAAFVRVLGDLRDLAEHLRGVVARGLDLLVEVY